MRETRPPACGIPQPRTRRIPASGERRPVSAALPAVSGACLSFASRLHRLPTSETRALRDHDPAGRPGVGSRPAVQRGSPRSRASCSSETCGGLQSGRGRLMLYARRAAPAGRPATRAAGARGAARSVAPRRAVFRSRRRPAVLLSAFQAIKRIDSSGAAILHGYRARAGSERHSAVATQPGECGITHDRCEECSRRRLSLSARSPWVHNALGRATTCPEVRQEVRASLAGERAQQSLPLPH